MTPLPEPAYQRLSDLQSGIDSYYTEQQMRDYGKAEYERGLRAQLAQPDRQVLQAAGTHPAPCARHCEAKAFEIEIRGLKSALRTALKRPVAQYSDIVSDGGMDPRNKYDTTTPQRKPLTIKEINAMPEAKGYWPMGMNDRIVRLIRAIEQAHGIKETP